MLAGIDGHLSYASASHPTGAWVQNDGTNYSLKLINGYANQMAAKVLCFNSTTNRTAEQIWESDQPGLYIAPLADGSPYRTCFLTKVINYDESFSSSDDVSVEQAPQPNTVNYVGGWELSGVTTNHTYEAGAVCVDTLDRVHDGGLDNVYGTTLATKVAYSNEEGGVVCGINGIHGAFTTADASNGVGMSYDATTVDWLVNASPGKQVEFSCVR